MQLNEVIQVNEHFQNTTTLVTFNSTKFQDQLING